MSAPQPRPSWQAFALCGDCNDGTCVECNGTQTEPSSSGVDPETGAYQIEAPRPACRGDGVCPTCLGSGDVLSEGGP